MYGRNFHASGAQGGSWYLTTRFGRLEGFALSKVASKPGDIGPRSVVSTIQAGPFICAALSP